jgi:hypothetical protein
MSQVRRKKPNSGTIRIDDQVREHIDLIGVHLNSNPNRVLRFVFGLEPSASAEIDQFRSQATALLNNAERARRLQRRTDNGKFDEAILHSLIELGGRARVGVLLSGSQFLHLR